MIKIATWNVNSLTVRLEHTLYLLQKHDIDILCLQELKLTDERFPKQQFLDIGYESIFIGQPTYNGVAIIYKNNIDIQNIQYNIPNYNDINKRLIKADFDNGKYSVVCAYFPNGQSVDSEKYIYKLNWLDNLYRYLANLKYQNLLLLGDYNITVDDIDVYDPITWAGKVLCSSREREFFNHLKDLNLIDAQRKCNPELNKIYTWWDYRMNAFKRKMGMRIDHIWISNSLEQYINSCIVDSEVRSLERPSDHAPVILELN